MKHLLNDLTEKEKNSIREQHTGSMNVVTENFSKLINAKSGDVKPLVNEDETSFGRKIKRGLRKVGSIFNQNKFIAEDLLSDYVASGKITEEDRDQIMSDISEMLSEINPYPYEENRESLVHDLVMKAVRIHKSNKENESSVNEQKGDVKPLVNEREGLDSDDYADDTDLMIEPIMRMLKPIYKKYGSEGVVEFLTDIIRDIEDVGDELFMGPEDYN
jgi:hypothetical protein